jgi:hypothetical protein
LVNKAQTEKHNFYIAAYKLHMRLNKYLKVVVIILAVFYAFKCAGNGHDFEVFVDAGGKIIHGLNIYKPPFAQNLNYYYSPLFALLLSPFSYLPIIVPQFLWILFSYFLMYRIWVLSTAYFNYSDFSIKQQRLWLFITFILALRFLLLDVGFVQMTTFLLWATLQSMSLFKQKKYVLGGALLALAINIKLLPLAFVVYLAYRNQWKPALLTIFFFVVYLFVPALYLGWEGNNSLLHDWFATLNPSNKEWLVEAENGPSSLVALIPVYITDTTGVLAFKRNFMKLNFGQVSLIVNVVRLVFVLFTLVFLRTLPFKAINSNLRRYWEMSYLFIVIPLIYPHQQQYAFVFITPVFIYLSYYFIANWDAVKKNMNAFLWALLIIVGINFTPLISSGIITHYVFDLLLYLRILPMAAIMLIVLLWICRPKAELITK